MRMEIPEFYMDVWNDIVRMEHIIQLYLTTFSNPSSLDSSPSYVEFIVSPEGPGLPVYSAATEQLSRMTFDFSISIRRPLRKMNHRNQNSKRNFMGKLDAGL